tara:strand:+ start:42 stop:1298 length:1257 start_codon:yes stop_codon:yes gene_type:complete
MKHQSPLLCLVLTTYLTTTVMLAQEWPRFRGKNGAGIGEISGLPDSFTSADYDWAVKLRGKGHSSPVLWGEKLFITIVDDKGKDRRLECYDSEKGKQLWKWSSPVSEHNLHDNNNFASSTPAVTKSGVFIVWGSGETTEAAGFSHSGDLLWNREWKGFSSDHGFGASPIISAGVLILHTDSVLEKKSQVMGLDPLTGETVWEFERITKGEDEKHLTAYNTPVTIDVGGQPLLIVLQTNDGWRGLDPKTGELAWHHKGDYNLRSVGSIVTGDNLIFATFGSGMAGKNATALSPRKNGKPKVLYELGLSDGLSYVPTPLIYKNRLYLWGDGGVLTCRNAKTGKLIYRERIGGNFYSSPIIADEQIWCGSRDGELIAVELGDQFKITGRSRLSSGMNATPAVANNRLFLRTDSHLISIKGR